MKQRFSLILTALLFCMMLAPAQLASDEPLAASDNGAVALDGLGNFLSMSLQVTPSALTVSPSSITLTSFDEPYRTDAMAFPLGISAAELTRWFADISVGFTGYDALENFYDLMPSTWSLDAVDTNTTGVYYASTVPNLGEDYTLADGLSLPHQLYAVSIQTPGKPDINCCISGRGFLHFPWILSTEQQERLDEFAVWLRQDSGEWTQLRNGFLFVSDSLQLSQRIFKTGSTYSLKVTYPGGQTGVLTFTYDGELNIIDYSGGDRDGGDVNGGGSGAGSQPAPTPPQIPDHSQNNDSHNYYDSSSAQNHSSLASTETPTASISTPETVQEKPFSVSPEPQKKQDDTLDAAQSKQPPLSGKPSFITLTTPIHPAPMYSNVSFSHESESTVTAPDTKNHAVSQLANRAKSVPSPLPDNTAAVSESYSAAQTVISGLRLRDLCADEESVVFGSGDLTVSIPSSLLLALNLSDSDTLSVRLTQPESSQIRFEAAALGKAVTELSGTVVRLRYTSQPKNTKITVLNEGGEEIKDAVFDGEFLRFTADKAGTYTILKRSKEAETQQNALPLLPLTGGLLLTAGGMTLFWRKHHG